MLSSSVYIVNASFRLPSASNWSELSKLKVNASNPITQIDSEFWNSRNIVLPDSDEKLYGGIIESPFFNAVSWFCSFAPLKSPNATALIFFDFFDDMFLRYIYLSTPYLWSHTHKTIHTHARTHTRTKTNGLM